MSIFAIADLHLPARQKPMDVFGENWANHFERISADWLARVTDADVVLLPGDISWAMRLEEAREDLHAIACLPGKKIMIRGNHDYWWSSVSRVLELLPDGFYALQNDAVMVDGVLFAGSRSWLLPGEETQAEDAKIFARELIRLEMSLKAARALSADAPLYVMTHYPPLTDACRDTPVTALLEKYGALHALYGHLHGAALYGAFRGEWKHVVYHQVSCDGIDFKLYRVADATD